jgi:transcription initiation factor IIF auxiliary subunit
MKSEILEGFVSGLKDLFEEHYIDVPEERYDVLGEMESKISELEEKLNEQVAANVEMSKTISEQKRQSIVDSLSEGLTDTETEKFLGLVEELSYEDADSFQNKVKTIRENYFTTKSSTEIKSVVTDAPVEALTEETKKVEPAMAAYLSVLSKNK